MSSNDSQVFYRSYGFDPLVTARRASSVPLNCLFCDELGVVPVVIRVGDFVVECMCCEKHSSK